MMRTRAMPSANERLERIAAYVRQHLQEAAEQYPHPDHDPVYRWEHTLRVASYGKRIAEAEGANAELAIAACLMHDVTHFECGVDYKNHGRLGAEISRPVLLEYGFPPQDVENICYAVAVHVDGRTDFEHPETLESKVVTDADNIDRFGAYRVLQWCAPEMQEYDRLIEKLTARLETLERYRQQELM